MFRAHARNKLNWKNKTKKCQYVAINVLQVRLELVLWLFGGCVNNFLLSPSIINDTISSGAVWQICCALIADCLVGNHLSQDKLNNYWFSASKASRWVVSPLHEIQHSYRLSVCSCWMCYIIFSEMLTMLYAVCTWDRRTQDVTSVVRNEGSPQWQPESKEGQQLVLTSDSTVLLQPRSH